MDNQLFVLLSNIFARDFLKYLKQLINHLITSRVMPKSGKRNLTVQVGLDHLLLPIIIINGPL